MSVTAPPMGRPKTQPHMRRLTQGPSETDTSIGSSRPLTMTEWKRRISEYAESIGQQKSTEAVRRMAKKVSGRDAAQGHMANPDRLIAQLFEQRDEPDPEPRLDHLDPCDPRVKAIDYSDPTGEEASTNVDKERAA